MLRGDLPFIFSYQLSAICFFPYPLFAPFALFFNSTKGQFGCKYLFSLLTCRLAIDFGLLYNSTYVLYWQIREQGIVGNDHWSFLTKERNGRCPPALVAKRIGFPTKERARNQYQSLQHFTPPPALLLGREEGD